MRIVAISDTHGSHRSVQVPGGDLLIHAGDLTRHGGYDELDGALDWLASLPHPHKIVIAGNHDRCMEDNLLLPAQLRARGISYLCDEAVEIGGLRCYGTPYQPMFRNMAFNLRRGPELRQVWQRVPSAIDILITHTPPQGIHDRTFLGANVGCADLADELQRICPRVHIFGHIHEAAGSSRSADTLFVNASILNGWRMPSNLPHVFDLDA